MFNLIKSRAGGASAAGGSVSPVMRALILAAAVVPALTACGIERSILSSKDVSSELLTDRPASAQVRIWFVRTRNDQLEFVPVIRSTSQKNRLQEAVAELLRGPSPEEEQEGLASEIPKGAVLIDVKENGEDIELNLSRRFSSGGGSSSFETRIDQLSKTVSELVGEHKVYLDVEGERLTTASGDGLEVKQPIN